MKKFYVLIVALLIGATASVSAIDLKSYPSDFKKGNIAINAGLGLGSPYSLLGNVTVPPIVASVDYALPIADLPFSFGALVGFTSTTYSWWGSTGYSYSDLCICGRGAYHFNFDVKGLDTYAGLMIGWDVRSTNNPYDTYPGTFAYGVFAGARYFFIPNVGAFAEVGYAFTYLSAGVTFKF